MAYSTFRETSETLNGTQPNVKVQEPARPRREHHHAAGLDCGRHTRKEAPCRHTAGPPRASVSSWREKKRPAGTRLAHLGPVCRQGASFRVCRPQSSPAAWWCSRRARGGCWTFTRGFQNQSAWSVCGIARTKSTITFCASDMHHNGRSRLGDLNRLRRSLCVRRQLTLSRHASELKPGLCVAYSARLMDHAAGGPSPKDDVESMFNE